MKLKDILKLSLIFLFFFSFTSIFADAPFDPPTDPVGTGAPLDGGLSLLIAGGIALFGGGIKSFYNKNKRNKN